MHDFKIGDSVAWLIHGTPGRSAIGRIEELSETRAVVRVRATERFADRAMDGCAYSIPIGRLQHCRYDSRIPEPAA